MPEQLTRISFERRLNALCTDDLGSEVAVAVSGGADSLCLTLMLNDWAKSKGIEIIALTVDHGLRPESFQEAKRVHTWLSERNIKHYILKWEGIKPKTRIEEKAREARYELLLDWCHAHKITYLFLAHQIEDQAETFFLRLSHSSGVDGLAAMKTITLRDGIFLVRPFLENSRVEIRNYLEKYYHQQWIEDPSNQDKKYERVRIRQALPELEKLGLSPQAVSLSVKRIARVRLCLETLRDSFLKTNVKWSNGGYVFIPQEAWENLPREIALRVLSFVLGCIGTKGVPRLDKLEKCCEIKMSSQTLSGCEIVPVKQGFFICRELSKMSPPVKLKPNTPTYWDRFYVCISKEVVIAPLREALPKTGLPAKVRRTLPALYKDKKLLWVPSLDYYAKKDDINGTVILKVSKWKKI